MRWYPERGFELDLNGAVGEITFTLVSVPVPADGTDELRAGPLELDKLEILFKAQVDVGGAPGQLAEASIRFEPGANGEQVILTALVEDAESGETTPIEVSVDVTVPNDAPTVGGPRPKPADEADLDWDDDDTFEAMFKDPLTQEDPLPLAGRAGMDFDEDDQDFLGGGGTGQGGPEVSEAAYDRLFKAILSPDSGPEDTESVLKATAEPTPAAPAAPEPEASAMPSSGHASLLAALLGGGDATIESSAIGDDPADARGLLEFLVEREELELEPDHTVDELVAGAAPILASPKPPSARAAALSEWLFEQDAVAELYVDDDSLASLIEQW
ncbi:MAG: hypothetical protein AB8H79_16770 [Myxococcota bacterium]